MFGSRKGLTDPKHIGLFFIFLYRISLSFYHKQILSWWYKYSIPLGQNGVKKERFDPLGPLACQDLGNGRSKPHFWFQKIAKPKGNFNRH